MAKLIHDEPVLVTSAAGAVVSYALTALVTHGVITHTVASTLTQQLVPGVAAALMIGLGALTRRLVAPEAKVRHLLEVEGLLTDADFGRLQAILEEAVLRHVPGAAPAPAAPVVAADPGQPAAAGAPA